MSSKRKIVISLYDHSANMVRPWAEKGYWCICYDIKHSEYTESEICANGGVIQYIKADLHDHDNVRQILNLETPYNTPEDELCMVIAQPVCTDLAVSGAAHFAKKRAVDCDFQTKAASHAIIIEDCMKGRNIPYLIENPVSVLSTLFRKPDHTFQPADYGGYLDGSTYYSQPIHPKYPDYFPPKDAYSKKTCYWTGGGFVMPKKRPVEIINYGSSNLHRKLGGSSSRTKEIRSETPRGVAVALSLFNSKDN
jgi:hypothetical protein